MEFFINHFYLILLYAAILFLPEKTDCNTLSLMTTTEKESDEKILISKSLVIRRADNPEIIEYSPLELMELMKNFQGTRAAYFPGWNLVTHSRANKVLSFCEKNNINAIMIDLKNVRGELFFHTGNFTAGYINAEARTAEGYRRIIDMDYLAKESAKRGIKIIGRFVMFRDIRLYQNYPEYQMESDEHWVDLRKDEVVNYNLSLLYEAGKLPVDEIALDYIRYPDKSGFGNSDQKLDCIEEIVEKCAETVHNSGTELSVYVFGWVAWNRKENIGQSIPRLAPYVDVIYPMLYPSHFYSGSLGFRNPSNHPYEIIRQGYEAAAAESGGTTIIPMLQLFWYTPSMILEQLKAVYCNNMPGFGCWNAAGNYKLLTRALSLSDEQAAREAQRNNDKVEQSKN